MTRFHRKSVPSYFHIFLVVLLGGAIIGICVMLLVLLGSAPPPGRINVIVASDPVTVWSWNTQDNTFAVVTIPSDIVITGLHGYGEYSLAALWKLGIIDKKNGSLLADSAKEALGVPALFYFGERHEDVQKQTDAIAYGERIFSFRTMPSFLSGRYLTNIPFSSFVALTRALKGVRPDKIHQIDLTSNAIAIPQNLPDGSRQLTLDPAKSDRVLKNVFEDDQIRKDGLAVAVYNTTSTPTLGNRMARLLSNLGVLVLTVGNDTPPVSRCTVSGDKQALTSQTAKTIEQFFHCLLLERHDERVDLVVRIGTDYANLFATRSEKKE